MVNGVFLDFAKPVTVEEANEAYERINAVGGE
jgi:hypothetical protein